MRDNYFGSEYSNLDSFVGRVNDHSTTFDDNNNRPGVVYQATNYGNNLTAALDDLGVNYTIGHTDPKKRTVTMMTEDLVAYGTDGEGYGEMPDWIDAMDVGHYETSSSESIEEYNAKHGTDYDYGDYGKWYYDNHYAPQLSALRGSIHTAQTEVGLITLATPVLIIGTVSSASSIVALGLESSSVSSLTYSTMWRQGVYRLSVRNSLGQFATGNGTQLAGRVFHQYYGLNGLGQATSFTSTIARGIPTAVRWAIGVGGSLLVANDRHGNRPSIRHRH